MRARCVVPYHGAMPAPPPPALVVLCTAPDAAAGKALARALVEEGLAACCNLVPGLTSVYRWEGEVREEGEVLLVLKTRPARLPELEARILELHPYDVPELVALEAAHVATGYLAWLEASTA